MTEEQKELLIARMIEVPSSLSDEELEAIVQDEELRALYEMCVDVEASSRTVPKIDTQEEWARFRPLLHRRHCAMRRFMRVAAIFLGVILAAGAIDKAIDRMLLYNEAPEIVKIEPSMPLRKKPEGEARPRPKPVEEALDPKPVAVQASVPHQKAYRKVQSEPSSDIDVDEYLRIQQAKVDNDLAIQEAEMYEMQKSVVLRIIDLMDEQQEDNNFRKVIMQ